MVAVRLTACWWRVCVPSVQVISRVEKDGLLKTVFAGLPVDQVPPAALSLSLLPAVPLAVHCPFHHCLSSLPFLDLPLPFSSLPFHHCLSLTFHYLLTPAFLTTGLPCPPGLRLPPRPLARGHRRRPPRPQASRSLRPHSLWTIPTAAASWRCITPPRPQASHGWQSHSLLTVPTAAVSRNRIVPPSQQVPYPRPDGAATLAREQPGEGAPHPLTAAIPMESPCCSCRLARFGGAPTPGNPHSDHIGPCRTPWCVGWYVEFGGLGGAGAWVRGVGRKGRAADVRSGEGQGGGEASPFKAGVSPAVVALGQRLFARVCSHRLSRLSRHRLSLRGFSGGDGAAAAGRDRPVRQRASPHTHGLSSDKMALITSECGAMRGVDAEVAVVTSDCVSAPIRWRRPLSSSMRMGRTPSTSR